MLNQFTVKSRLIGLAAIPLLILILMSVVSLYDMKLLSQGVDSLYQDRVKPLQQIKIVSDAYAVTVVDTLHKHRAGLLDAMQANRQLEQASRQAAEAWRAYQSTRLTAEEQQLMQVADQLIGKWQQQVALYQQQIQQQQLLQTSAESFNQQLYQLADPLSQALDKLIQLQLTEAGVFTQAAAKNFQQMIWLFSVVVGIFIVLLIRGC